MKFDKLVESVLTESSKSGYSIYSDSAGVDAMNMKSLRNAVHIRYFADTGKISATIRNKNYGPWEYSRAGQILDIAKAYKLPLPDIEDINMFHDAVEKLKK